jgi:hypothetical protein
MQLSNQNKTLLKNFYNITPYHHRRLWVDDMAYYLRHELGYKITYAELFAICEG